MQKNAEFQETECKAHLLMEDRGEQGLYLWKVKKEL